MLCSITDKERENMSIGTKQNNCLNLFKLIAALQVMYGHLIAHLEIQSNAYFNEIFAVFQGVPIFFTLSGFLIWFSLERAESQENLTAYIRNRYLRIYPELWVAVAVEIIVMCVLYRGWNIKDTALFTAAQSTFLQFWTPDSLRGYGCGTPNGTLGSICVIIQFYIVAGFIFKFMKTRKWFVWVIALIASIFISNFGQASVNMLHNEILTKLYGQTIFRCFWLFLMGMCAARYFDKLIPICKKLWPVFISLAIIVSIFDFDIVARYRVLRTLLVFLAILGFAYSFPRLKLKRDISYGIFLYHMTVANAMITFGFTGSFFAFLTAAALSCVLAYVSTITIGKFAFNRR